MKKIRKILLLVIIMLVIPLFTEAKIESDINTNPDNSAGLVMGFAEDSEKNVITTSQFYSNIIKYDKDNNVLWQQDLSTEELDVTAITVDSSNNIYVLATKQILIENTQNITGFRYKMGNYLLKFSPEGNRIFEKNLFFDDYINSYGLNIKIYNDELYYLFNSYENPIERSFDGNTYTYDCIMNNRVTKLSLEGALIFNIVYNNSQSSIDSHIYAGGGGYQKWILGDFLFNNDSFYVSHVSVAKIDYQGNVLHTYGDDLEVNSITKSEKNGIILTREVYENGTKKSKYLKLSQNLELIKEEQLLDDGATVEKIRKVPNGYFINATYSRGEKAGLHLYYVDNNFNIVDSVQLRNRTYGAELMEISLENADTILIADNYNNANTYGYYKFAVERKELAKEMVIDSRLEINTIFDEINIEEEIDKDSLVWAIENPSILKIENGIIVPLKKGETIISTTFGDKEIIVRVIVKDDLVKEILTNPKTYSTITLVIIELFTILLIGYNFLIKKKRKRNK